jgi:tetratricopeptide (TPR) repeat protein
MGSMSAAQKLSPSARSAKLRGSRVTFAGRLASMSHSRACRIVREAGGETSSVVTNRTTVLVVGMRGWPVLPDGSVSRKLQQAQELAAKRGTLRILSEIEFLEWAGLREQRESVSKSYSAEDICRHADVSPHLLRRLELLGLIRSQDGLYAFQDIASLRTVADLIQRGVRPQVIAESFHRLSEVLPGTETPLAQLNIATGHRDIVAELGELCIDPRGQLLFKLDGEPCEARPSIRFHPPIEPQTDWFERGVELEEAERYDEAAEAYRKAIGESPDCAETFFNLANVLRAAGKLEAAGEVYRLSIALGPEQAEAWYNLAGIEEEQGDLQAAVGSLEAALKACPSYADAHFNLALALEKTGRAREAPEHWATYLKLDPHSEWACVARHHLALGARG